MRKLLLLLLFALPIQAQQTYPVNSNGGNITAANAACVPTACIGITASGLAQINVAVSGTFSATLKVEKSTDGVAFISAGSDITSAGVTTYASTSVVLFRVRASAFVSGDAGVTISGTGAGGTVNAVTASPPLASSGGATPNITVANAQGNGALIQLSTGSTVPGNCVKYDGSGNAVDSGVSCGIASGAHVIASGTQALATALITSGSCATTITVTATGSLTTDNVMLDFTTDPTAVTGYVPGVTGILTIFKWLTADTVNIKVCNMTAGSITPGAATLSYRVIR